MRICNYAGYKSLFITVQRKDQQCTMDSPMHYQYLHLKKSLQDFTDVPIPLEEISTANNDKSKTTARKPSIVSLSELKLIHYKLAVAFGICCIVMLFMLPVIFYYVEGDSRSEFSNSSPAIGIGIVDISQVATYVVYNSVHINALAMWTA